MSIRSISNSATQYFVIDKSTRTITAPAGFKNFGVESDENSNRVYFQCPRYVGDNLDLATLNIRVNFQNANKEKDQYIVTDVAIDGENIRFSWVLSRKATAYKGSISFIICAVKTNAQGVITNEWNTTLATGAVLSGLEVEAPEIPEEVTDIVNQLLDIVNTAKSDMEVATAEGMANIKTAENQAIEAVLNTPNSLMANAIKGSASGEIIAVHDVSPLEHTVNVKVQSKNIASVVNVRDVAKAYDPCLWIEGDLQPGKTYAISFIGAAGHKFYTNENLFANSVSIECDGTRKTIIQTTKADISKDSASLQYTAGKGWIIFKNNGGNTAIPSFTEFQMELGGTATEYTPYVSPESVTLTRCGKNLAPINDFTVNGTPATVNSDIGGIQNSVLIKDIPIGEGKTYIISMSKPAELERPKAFLYNGTLTATTHTSAYVELVDTSRGVEVNALQRAIVNSANYEHLAITTGALSTFEGGVYVSFDINNLQVELGETATGFESYNGAEYTPSTDGTANVTSLAPNMTLFTDTKGVNIECEYNKNSNVVIQELIERITALENQGS